MFKLHVNPDFFCLFDSECNSFILFHLSQKICFQPCLMLLITVDIQLSQRGVIVFIWILSAPRLRLNLFWIFKCEHLLLDLKRAKAVVVVILV